MKNWVIALLAPSITPTMFSEPTASSTDASPLTTEFWRLLKLVAMPCVPSLACSENDAKPLPPSLSRRTSASQKSFMVTSPCFSASYRSLALLPCPSMLCATWSSWPGIAVWMLLQSSSSGLPLASTWLNCSSAASCTCVLAPPASSASLNESMMSVALPTSFTVGTIF